MPLRAREEPFRPAVVPPGPCPTARPSRGRPAFAVLGLVFFLSGCAALVYQVAWQRILALQTGMGIQSVAIIVAAFMLGLGLGSLAGGVVSARLTPRGALRAFGAIELGVAAFAAASVWLYYDLLYARGLWLFAAPGRAALVQFLSLLPPTALMGMSLPCLVQASLGETRTAARMIGYLYGVNVLGAAFGAALAPWILVRYIGIEGAVWIAAGLNLVAGLGGLAVGTVMRGGGAEPEPGPAGLHVLEPALPLRAWIALYAWSGFCALSLEILWFRIVDVAVKSTAFTFGSVLGVYLLGVGAGSLLGGGLASRVRRPRRAFLLCQCLVLAWAGGSLLLLTELPVGTPGYAWYVAYWGKEAGVDFAEPWAAADVWRLYGLLPLCLYGPPTLLMGLSFAMLQRAVQNDASSCGYRVGVLQAANIAGCTAGGFVTGVWLLDRFGTPGTLAVLLAGGLVFAAVGWRDGHRRTFGAAAAVLATLALLQPAASRLWQRLHGQPHEADALVAEDATGVSAITRRSGTWIVWTNGKTESWIPFGGVHTWLGAVPVLIHPNPRHVAVVGLGSADTAWGAGLRPETARITVFELRAQQPRLLRELAHREDLAPLRAVLEDPRVEIRLGDGRIALERDRATYDVIEIDALRPTSAYSGNLGSTEFFRACARKLNKGGLMSAWSPTPRISHTFRSVFPHVISVGAVVLIGSHEPIEIDAAAWAARARAPQVSTYLGAELAERLAQRLLQARPGAVARRRDLNRDLFPRDELLTP